MNKCLCGCGKKCNKTFVHGHNNNHEGHTSKWTDEYRREYHHRDYLKNKERYKKLSKKWKKENKERLKAIGKEYRKTYPEKHFIWAMTVEEKSKRREWRINYCEINKKRIKEYHSSREYLDKRTEQRRKNKSVYNARQRVRRKYATINSAGENKFKELVTYEMSIGMLKEALNEKDRDSSKQRCD